MQPEEYPQLAQSRLPHLLVQQWHENFRRHPPQAGRPPEVDVRPTGLYNTALISY